MRAAEAEPVWCEDPAAGQAGADGPELHRCHPETCRPGAEPILAATWPLAHQSEAGHTEPFQRLSHLAELFKEPFLSLSL